jgi:AcrR family transcriptional regulator
MYNRDLKMSKPSVRPAKKPRSPALLTWDAIAWKAPPEGLSRPRIIEAAIRIADKDGLAAVSARRIAAELACASQMSLYHYVPSMRDLLNLMLDSVSAEFQWPAERITDWRIALSQFAEETRRTLKRHPWATTLRTAHAEYGPEVARVLESILSSLSRFGIDLRTSNRIIWVVWLFVNRFVEFETGAADTPRSKNRRVSGHQFTCSGAVLASGQFPNVQRLLEMESEPPEEEFERSLNLILNGVASELELAVSSR